MARMTERASPRLGMVWRMSKIMTWCACLVLVTALASAVPGAGAALPASGTWGKAISVPGRMALNTRGAARVGSVSCASAGNCAAGGHYRDRHGQQGFVTVQRHDSWGAAIGVPGLAALNQGGYAGVSSVSCGSIGNCAA